MDFEMYVHVYDRHAQLQQIWVHHIYNGGKSYISGFYPRDNNGGLLRFAKRLGERNS